jgi:capsular polysaccharide biosynthesis protein
MKLWEWHIALLSIPIDRFGPQSRPVRTLLRFANAVGRSLILPIVWLDEWQSASTLAPSTLASVTSPDLGDGSTTVSSIDLPPIHLYRFGGAIVASASSAFALRDSVVIERVPGINGARCVLEGGEITLQRGRAAAVDARSPERVERGFFLAGYGYWNYYHWLIELLPKLAYWRMLDAEFRSWPLLIGESVPRLPSFLDALELFAPGAPTYVLEDHRRYAVDDLLHISAPNIVPFNLRGHARHLMTDVRLNPATVADWRQRVGLQQPRQLGERRLFLARKGPRRLYNQDAAIAELRDLGFEPVFLEEMSLREQADVVSDAEMIVGPSGAAWTNLLFATPGAKGLCWVNERVRTFAGFSTLAHAVGVKLRYSVYTPDGPGDHYSANYTMDVSDLRRRVAALLTA